MKYTEVKNNLVERLSEILTENDFKYIKSSNEYLKKTDEGYFALSVLVADYAPDFDVNMVFSIRINKVQEHFNDFSKLDEKGKASGSTIDTRIGYFLNKEQGFEFEVTNEDELKEVGDQLKKVVEEHGFKFFDEFKEISKLDRVFNSAPKENSPHIYILHDRIFKATIIAKLNDNPDFDSLIKIYREELKRSNKETEKRYEKLINHLNEI